MRSSMRTNGQSEPHTQLSSVVSYRYELSKVDRNHERFLQSGHVDASRRVLRLLSQPR